MVDDSHAMGIAKTTGPDAWEAAYLRFETSEQASHRALRRLQKLGVAQLPRDARVVELFCGRGNGLHALASLGFTKLEGVDFRRGWSRFTAAPPNATYPTAANFLFPIIAGTC